MKRLLAAVALTVGLVVSTPAPADAHTIYCAAYVGNPCYQRATLHRCVHVALARVSHKSGHVPPGVVVRCVAQARKAAR